MAAFVGVYDGHDGDLASEYCSTGLVPHILFELSSQSQQQARWGFGPDRANAPLDFETPEVSKSSSSKLKQEYVAAFQKAHDRFCNNLEAPTFEEISKPGLLKVAPPSSYNPMQWMATAVPPPRGGTTACTMSVVSQHLLLCHYMSTDGIF